MPVSHLLRRIVAGAAGVALAAAAACTRDSTAPAALTAPQQPALSASEAQSVGDAMTVDVGSELEGVSAFGSPFMPGMFAEASSDDAARCMPTFSPLPVVDSDGDRVPDSVHVTFAGCAFAMGAEADTVRGAIDVVDPTPKIADRDVRIRFRKLCIGGHANELGRRERESEASGSGCRSRSGACRASEGPSPAARAATSDKSPPPATVGTAPGRGSPGRRAQRPARCSSPVRGSAPWQSPTTA